MQPASSPVQKLGEEILRTIASSGISSFHLFIKYMHSPAWCCFVCSLEHIACSNYQFLLGWVVYQTASVWDLAHLRPNFMQVLSWLNIGQACIQLSCANLFWSWTHLAHRDMHYIQSSSMQHWIPQICPPFLHASIRQNRRGGLCVKWRHFFVTTITDPKSPSGHVMLALPQAVW